MFTAVVLVCLNGIKEPELCDAYFNYEIWNTREECMIAISTSIKTGAFEYYIDEQTKIEVVDYRCINWDEITL